MVRLLITTLFMVFSVAAFAAEATLDDWSYRERALINAMLIDNLGPPPPDPSNRFSDNTGAAELGEQLFNDKRFSANDTISCAKCHRADYNFTDPLPRAQGVGTSTRRTMPVIGMAYHKWFFWDGRKDSSWAQALAPLENPVEHGISRTRVAQLIYEHYSEPYQAVIGPLPEMDPFDFSPLARSDSNDKETLESWQAIPEHQRDQITRVFVNTGKVLASFVHTLKPTPAPFDIFARSLAAGDREGMNSLSDQQIKGLRLFINDAKCINCHNGPLLTNGEFHHAGIPDTGEPDRGRAEAIKKVAEDEFGCLSTWSDADPEYDCKHVRFITAASENYERAFKTPSLRNVANRPPYMHAGQFATLSEVLQNYRDVPGEMLTDELFHNELSDKELEYLEAFLNTLTSIESENKFAGRRALSGVFSKDDHLFDRRKLEHPGHESRQKSAPL